MNLRGLWEELRNRKVVRTAWLYALAAWGVIQVTATIQPFLRIPSAAVTGLIITAIAGFPIALALAWHFDLDSSADAARRRRRRALLLIAVLLPLLAGIGLWRSKQNNTGMPPSDRVAIFPFSFRGTQDLSYLGEGMVDLLSAKLDGGGWRAIEKRVLLERVSADASGMTGPAMKSISKELGAGYYIDGSIVTAGNNLHITATLHNALERTEPVATAAVDGDVSTLFRMLDDLTLQLLSRLSPASGDRLVQIAALTTQSLPAMRAYLEGESAFRAGEARAAVQSFQRAVAADSGFALAWYRLSSAAQWWNRDPTLARESMERALFHSHRLSRYDRLRVEALAAYRRGHFDETEQKLRTILSVYPEDAEAWYWLGTVLMNFNPSRGRSRAEAWEPLRQSLRLDPGRGETRIHFLELAFAQKHLPMIDSLLADSTSFGEFDPVLAPTRSLAQADTGLRNVGLRNFPEIPGLNARALGFYFIKNWNDPALLSRLIQPLTDPNRPLAQQIGARGPLVEAALAAGQLRAARQHIAWLASHDAPAAARAQVLAVQVAFPTAAVADLQTAIDAVRRGFSGDTGEIGIVRRNYMLGLLNARLGREPKALVHIDSLRQTKQQPIADLADAAAALILAELRWQQQRFADALQALEHPPVNFNVLHSRLLGVDWGATAKMAGRSAFLRAEVLRALGRQREAEAWYAATIEGWVALAAAAHYRLAEIHDQSGKRAEALANYARFIELWREPDDELRPYIERAQMRLRALGPDVNR